MPAGTFSRLTVLVFSLLLVACGDEFNPGFEPPLPTNPSPAINAVNQPISIELRWSFQAGERPGVHYDVRIGAEEDPPVVAQGLATAVYHPIGLAHATTYYWRVVVVDLLGERTEGPLWQFTTSEGRPPAAPTNPITLAGAQVVLDRVTLRWTGPDEDGLAYDVYFGTAADPPVLSTDLTMDSLEVPVAAWTTYYWRVVAHNLDGSSSSPAWSFSTLPVPGHMYNWAGTGSEGFGDLDQLPLATQLYWPQDISFAPDGSPVVVDWNNHRVLIVDNATGRFRMLAGSLDGQPGEPCLPAPSPCDEVDGADTRLNHPTSVTFGPDGNMVLCAWHNSSVFLLDMASGLMNRICGTGLPCYNGDERPAITACVYLPAASAYDPAGLIVFCDQANMIIRKIDESGVVHTIAGTKPVWNGSKYIAQTGFSGDEGPATSAKLNFATAETCGKICIDGWGNLYIPDTKNHCVRVVDAAGTIHRFAGLYPATPGYGGDGGPATSAMLNEPRDIACDHWGNVYIADTGNHIIRKVDPQGVISTVAGIPMVSGTSQEDGKLATQSTLNLPYGIELDAAGRLWIADTQNSRIRVVY